MKPFIFKFDGLWRVAQQRPVRTRQMSIPTASFLTFEDVKFMAGKYSFNHKFEFLYGYPIGHVKHLET